MENIIQFQKEKMLDYDSLFLVSLILLEVSRIIQGIQMIVAVLLRYVAVGIAITDSLMDFIVPQASNLN